MDEERKECVGGFLASFRGVPVGSWKGPYGAVSGLGVQRDGVLIASKASENALIWHQAGVEMQRRGSFGVTTYSMDCRGAISRPQSWRFYHPGRMCIPSDVDRDEAYVVDRGNHCVHVLSAGAKEYHIFGYGAIVRPQGVCVSDSCVYVTENCDWDHSLSQCRVTVFDRGSLARLFSFGMCSTHDTSVESLCRPEGVCFVRAQRRVAVADTGHSRVALYSAEDGAFALAVGVGVLRQPRDVVCSLHGDLVVADTGNARIVVFAAGMDGVSADATFALAFGSGAYTCLALHKNVLYAGSAIYHAGVTRTEDECIAYE